MGSNLLIRRRRIAGSDPYSEAGYRPALVAAFADDYYRANRGTKPLSAVVTHSRASNATMVDSDGLIKWAPHNLLPYSEDFTQWSNLDTTDSVSSTVAAPDGSFATEIFETTANNDHIIFDASLTLSAQVYTHSCFSKYNGRHIQIRSAGEGTGFAFANFDLLNGVVGNSGGSNLQSATIESYGDGWYRCSISVLHTASGTGVGILSCKSPLTDGEAFATTDLEYTGDITKGFYVYGAHLYRSDLGGMVDVPAGERSFPSASTYVPTTSAARYLPRVGHHVYNGSAWVNEGVLAESEARTNLLTYSSEFDNAAWTKNNATVVTASTTAPDGTTIAKKLRENTSSSSHYIYQISNSALVTSSTWTFSVYIKDAGDSRFIQLRPSGLGAGVAYATFDPTDGSLTASGGSALVGTPASTSVGNNWYRVSMTCSADIVDTNDGVNITLTNSGTASENPSYIGDNTKGVYIWGAQFETAPTPSSYIPTAGSTVTRAAETFLIPAANLPWPTETYGPELVTNGTFDTDISGWSNLNATSVWDAGKISVTSSSSPSGAYQSFSTEAGKAYIAQATMVDRSGVSVSGPLLRCGNGSAPNAGLVDSAILSNGQTATVYFVATGSTSYVYLRAEDNHTCKWDNVSVRELTRYPVSIQMNGRMTYADNDTDNTVTALNWARDVDTRITLVAADTLLGRTGDVEIIQEAGGVVDLVRGADSYTPGILVPFNIASRHGMTFVNGAVDGVALTEDTTPTNLPDLSATDLDLASTFMGTVETFRMWGVDLGDGGIELASAPSLEPSLSLTFDSSESSFIVDDWSA